MSRIGEEYDKGFLRELYRRMRLVREVERELDDLVGRGEIPGDAHLCTGQEAVAVGACAPLRDDDIVAGTHRSHGHAIAKGVDTEELMAEFGGRNAGVSRGRGGEMHLFSPEDGLLETTGIVAAHLPHVAGALLASGMDDDDCVGMAFFGDGATNEGVLFETMNMASIWDLPMVFVCENNQYGVSTSREYAVAGDRIADRAQPFEIPDRDIDGQNVLAVYEAVSRAIDDARTGRRPQFVECETYRYSGHYSKEKHVMADRPYRSEAEIREWRERHDPVETFATRLADAGVLPAAERDVVDDDVDNEVAAAVEFLRQSDLRSADQATEAVYADDDYPTLPVRGYR